MACSASFSLACSHQFNQLHYPDLKWRRKRLGFLNLQRRKSRYLIVKSVLNSKRPLSISNNGTTEPARILLERLFAQTQKLEQQIGRDPSSPHAAELGVNLGKLESDLQAALAALKKKEEDLQDAERKLLSEYNEISRARMDLEQREDEIVAVRMRQEKLEEELRLANLDLASQAAEIGDLKLCLQERDREISASQSALSAKEDEIKKMKHELTKKSEEAANAEYELRSKARLLDEANKVVEKQEVELQQLRRTVQKKEGELQFSISMQKNEAEQLKVVEAKLEEQTMDWLVAQQELQKLAEQTSKYVGETNETLDEFGRVKKLLSDVRSELVSSQKALASSRLKMEGQDQLLEKQLAELEVLRGSVMSYMTSLRDAEVEVESEKVKLRVVEARNRELEMDLSLEKELLSELKKELDKERLSLEQALLEMSSLQEEIDRKSAAFEETQTLLQSKETELVEARLEIQHLKSEQASLQLMLAEKDLELSDAKKMLEEVNQEIAELNQILFSREDELIQAMSMLKEKDEHVQTMQHELSNAKLKSSEAEAVVEKIVDLTKEVILSFNDKDFHAPSLLDQNIDKAADSFKWQNKQLETELQLTQESLRVKEMEVLAVQKALAIKDEEIKMVLQKLEAKEKEITTLKGEMMRDKDDLKQLYALAQKRIDDKSVGELAIEKLEIEAAQLDVEAATSALERITELSQKLLNNASLCIEDDYYDLLINGNQISEEVKSEVSRLLTLTDQLVREAGIAAEPTLTDQLVREAGIAAPTN